MTDLIDRIAGTAIDRPKINLHRFMGAERLYAMGEWAGAELATEFDFQGDELTQATQLKDEIDAQVGADAKMLYIARVEGVCMCLEDHDDRLYHNMDGSLDRPKIYEDLQITG